jgi:hypothetical protein
MHAQAQGGTHYDLIEDRGGGVDQQLATAGGAHDATQVSGIDVGNGNAGIFAQKMVSALQIAVPAPDRVSLPVQ